MTDWSEIRRATERLRLSTARLKAKRLKLPMPGVLVKVRSAHALAIYQVDQMMKQVVIVKNELLLLACVNMNPEPHPKGPLVDPVELIFVGRGGALHTTGTRAAADVMNPYEVL